MQNKIMKAYFLCTSIDLKKYRSDNPLEKKYIKRDSLFYETDDDGIVIVYSFGAVVFYNVDEPKIGTYISNIKNYAENVLNSPYWDDYEISIDKKNKEAHVEFDTVFLKKQNESEIMIVAKALASSVALDYYDSLVNGYLEKTDVIHEELATKGKFSTKEKDILKLIGSCNQVRQLVITKLSLLGKPDVVWEDEELETIFVEMYEMLEFEERFETLSHKLQVINEHFSTMLDIIRANSDHRLEWVIIILIAVEIFIYIFDLMIL